MEDVNQRSGVALGVLLALFLVAACSRDPRVAAIEQLADVIESDFVYPEVGKQYAAELRRRLEAGAYSDLRTKAEVAAAVTADLQRILLDQNGGWTMSAA